MSALDFVLRLPTVFPPKVTTATNPPGEHPPNLSIAPHLVNRFFPVLALRSYKSPFFTYSYSNYTTLCTICQKNRGSPLCFHYCQYMQILL